MKYAIVWVDTVWYGKGKLFDLNSGLNTDDRMYCYHALREGFRAKGIELITQDMATPRQINPAIHGTPLEQPFNYDWSEYEFILFNDSDLERHGRINKRQYKIIWECEVVKWNTWNKDIYNIYDKVFSWYPEWGDKKYIQYYWPIKIKPQVRVPKMKFLCMFANGKTATHYKEMYSKREEAIRYFINDIDVYGSWLNATPLPSNFKGPVPEKLPVLSQYKFAICYENAHDIKGYVTEKIFDCFMAGTVPVYIGNADHISKNCYVPADAFSYTELEEYLRTMPDDLYQHYLDSARDYLARTPHNVDKWVDLLVSEMAILNN